MQKPKEISDLGLKSGTIDSDLMGAALCRACRGRGRGGRGKRGKAIAPIVSIGSLPNCPISPLPYWFFAHFPIGAPRRAHFNIFPYPLVCFISSS